MEGKKYRVLCQDCRGVSEVYGQLLMISIVVIAFSTIAVTVFSEGGAVKPEHIPNTDLREKIHANTLYITHNGGEAIDRSAIKIILTAGNKRSEYSGVGLTIKNPEGTPLESSDKLFTLGDYIEIEISDDLMNEKEIEMFFVDTPSQQVIQKVILSTGNWKPPEWITPHPYGSIYDNSTDEWLSTELLDGIDGEFTTSNIQKDQWIFQQYTFGIDADEMGFPYKLSMVLLNVTYQSKDHSLQNLTLSISTDDSTWTQIAPPPKVEEYNSIDACLAANVTYDITDYVKTADKLEKLSVKFSAIGNAASNKYSWVDFVGIQVK
ncbi:hypothetical protein MSKOL_0497 [Methanosarcina sp. Kolksee]|uniref:type IV pilin N-terminal domain-containing protein n=1 Tax=Methanosarcina sp. Kolksee TaxID=1434099 RepID=UPI000615D1C6|nr:type IV pilin N-terminal domain-containing protein [Methanosarcina sp. Kolksee]AKB46274.1 hypothetical protein MSKOL_0497 [Methanosarcina sp. Kolksee]